jgi:hypothetical protein
MKHRIAQLFLSTGFLLVFLSSGVLSSITPFLATPQAAAAAGDNYTLYYPTGDEFKGDLLAAAKDGEIGDHDNELLSQTMIYTKGGRLGTAQLKYDSSASNDQDKPIYTTNYYCMPNQGYKLSLTADESVPYVRITMAVALEDHKDWGDIAGNGPYKTYVGAYGKSSVGTVHFPKYVQTTGQGNLDAQNFDLPGKQGSNDIQTNIDVNAYYAQDTGGLTDVKNSPQAKYNFNMYPGGGSLPSDPNKIGDVLNACMPSPDGNIGDATTNYNKDPNKDVWAAAIDKAGFGQAGDDTNKSGDTDTGEESPSCETSGFSLAWILCSIFNWMSDGAHWMLTQVVQPFLVTPPISTDPEDPAFQIWSNFRIYGNIFLVIALLVIVFGQSIGGGLVDAYTAKKVLPRLLTAAILINLSIYIVAFLVDASNILGHGISGLLTAPLTDCSNNVGNCWQFELSNTDVASVFSVGLVGFLASSTALSGFFGALFFGGTAAAGAAFTAAFFVLLPIIFAVAAVFLTLVIRKGLILFLILVSPVAFALYCLPNTEKYFRKWWEILVEALMVYPIIIAIFGVADILTVTILGANQVTPAQLQNMDQLTADGGRTLALVVGFLLQFVPLLMIPFAFRFASGLMRRIYDVATGAGGKVHEAATTKREQTKKDYTAQSLASRARIYHSANKFGETSKIPFSRTAGRFAARRAGGYNIESLMSAQRAEVGKQIDDQINTGRDEEIRGLNVNKAAALAKGGNLDLPEGNGYVRNKDGVREFKSLGGAWVKEQDVDAGQRRWGRNQFAQQAALSYEMRKAMTEDQTQFLAENFNSVATQPGGWNLSEGEAGGMFTGAAFANQNQHLEYKYTDSKDGSLKDDGAGLVDEIYEKRGSYQMAQMGANTFTSLMTAHDELGKKAQAGGPGADEARLQQRKVQAIAETFMSRGGIAGGHMEDGKLIPAAEGASSGQTMGQGAGHVNERIRDLAVHVGVYKPLPEETNATSKKSPSKYALPPDHDRQN